MRKLTGLICLLALLAGGCSKSYTVRLAAEPAEGGTVSGAGVYPSGEVVDIAASANTGFRFDHWSDGSTAAHRRIMATGNVDWVAHFVRVEPVVDPEVPNPDIRVTFGDITWYGTAVRGAAFDDFGYPVLQLLAVQSKQCLPLPMAGLNIPPIAGSFASHGDTTYSCFYQPSGSSDTVVYQGQTYPRWIALADGDSVYCSGTVKSLDLTARTVSLTLSAQMLDMAAFAASAERVMTTMSIRLNNVSFELDE